MDFTKRREKWPKTLIFHVFSGLVVENLAGIQLLVENFMGISPLFVENSAKILTSVLAQKCQIWQKNCLTIIFCLCKMGNVKGHILTQIQNNSA